LLTLNVPYQIGKCTPRGTCTPVWEPLIYSHRRSSAFSFKWNCPKWYWPFWLYNRELGEARFTMGRDHFWKLENDCPNRCRSRQIFGGVKEFFPDSPNLLEKSVSCQFRCLYF